MNNKMKMGLSALTMTAAVAFSPVASSALSYSQDFEGANPGADINIGDSIGESWQIGNVDSLGGAWFAGAAAPNSPTAGVNGYSAFVDEGGAGQGNTQLSVFSDYNPWSPFVSLPATETLTTFVYTDLGAITADMVGNTYTFSFDAKLKAATDANAYINVLKTSDNSFATLFSGSFQTSNLNAEVWEGGSVDITVDSGMVGELLQIGFNTTTSAWGGSDVFYDNLNFAAAVPVPAAVWLFGSAILGLVGVARRKA